MRKIESDGTCLLVAEGRGGRGGGGSVDGLISGSDYLLITIRREPLERRGECVITLKSPMTKTEDNKQG